MAVLGGGRSHGPLDEAMEGAPIEPAPEPEVAQQTKPTTGDEPARPTDRPIGPVGAARPVGADAGRTEAGEADDRGTAAPEAGLRGRRGREPAEPDPNRVGVVFVHGIGSQLAGETLLSWARPLIRLVGRWGESLDPPAPYDPVLRTSIDFSGVTLPSLELSVPAAGGRAAQTWVLTEAWWATRVQPPPLSVMLDWLVLHQARRVLMGILRGLGRAKLFPYDLIEKLLLPLFVVPLSILFALLFVVFRVVQVVPIKAVREFVAVRAAESFLVDWFGDVRILLTDRAQAANIRAGLARSIRALRRAGCGRIVVVGHSGGTIVSYTTLVDPAHDELPVDRLITHGQALDLGWRLGEVGDDRADADRPDDVLHTGDLMRRSLAEVRKTSATRKTLDWYDFWSTHDPAPAGGFDANDETVARPADCGGASFRISNRMSLRNDHGGYWDNLESFVLPVARLIDTAGEPAPAASRFYPDGAIVPPALAARRDRRVRDLWLAWAGYLVAAAAVVGLALPSLETIGIAAYDLLGRLAAPLGWLASVVAVPQLPPSVDGAGARTVALGALAIAIYTAGRVMSGGWTRWDALEQWLATRPDPSFPSLVRLRAGLVLGVAATGALAAFSTTAELAALVPSAVLIVAAGLLERPPRATRRSTPERIGPGPTAPGPSAPDQPSPSGG